MMKAEIFGIQKRILSILVHYISLKYAMHQMKYLKSRNNNKKEIQCLNLKEEQNNAGY